MEVILQQVMRKTWVNILPSLDSCLIKTLVLIQLQREIYAKKYLKQK